MKHPWHFELEAKLLEPIVNDDDYRKIIWYLDEVGNTGKTLFSSYMKQKHGAVGFSSFGGSTNAGHLIKGSLDAGWDGKIIIIDLSRTICDTRIYGPLENIRNGEITNTKFSTCDLSWDSGHVVCFANWLPDFSVMSQDRWDIRRLARHGDSIITTSIPTEEAREMSKLMHVRAGIASIVTEGLKNRNISDIEAIDDTIDRLIKHRDLLETLKRSKELQQKSSGTIFEPVYE